LRKIEIVVLVILAWVVANVVACGAPTATPTTFVSSPPQEVTSRQVDLQASLEEAIQARLDRFLADFLGEGLKDLKTSKAQIRDRQFARWQGVLTPQACPLVHYKIAYQGVYKDGKWELYEEEDGETNLARAWAVAYSAAHDGAKTAVPGMKIRREVSLNPSIIGDILQSALEDPDSNVMRATAGFYICITDADGYGNLPAEDLKRVQELIPQVREALQGSP